LGGLRKRYTVIIAEAEVLHKTQRSTGGRIQEKRKKKDVSRGQGPRT